MNKKEIEKRYNELVASIEDAGIYDGRGTYDLYKCEKCGNEKITTYADKGVTPFIIGCDCGGSMQHTKSYNSVPDYIRVFKWKRSDLVQIMRMSDGMIEHVLNGGLVLDTDIHTDNHKQTAEESLEKKLEFEPPLTRQQRRKLERLSKKMN